MIKVLRRVSEYTKEEFIKYCNENGLDVDLYIHFYRHWAIAAHEEELNRFIRLSGENQIVTVSGILCLDNTHYRVKPKTLTLKKAFEEMLTPDAQDFGITFSLKGMYYVYILHSRGHNVFKFSLDDKN